MSNIFEELTQRGYTEQLTHPEEIKNLLDNESISFYIGFDPTADSLHVGHFISLMVASHMQKAGHRPMNNKDFIKAVKKEKNNIDINL